MNCIVVDDDKLARTALKKMISKIDFLNLKAECASGEEAFNYLKTETIDLVFLDVEMPGMSGIELLKNLEKRPIVILITAKKNYAVEAFELNVADYIIKPVSPERFGTAVERAQELFNLGEVVNDTVEKNKEYIFVRANSILTRIKLKDIIYIESLGDYVKINTSDSCNTIACTMEKMEEKLPANKFYRVHKSYLMAIDRIEAVEDNTAISGKHLVPVGAQYKKGLMKKLQHTEVA